nr:hypothetical protein [Tanacetum cinerariifolium]
MEHGFLSQKGSGVRRGVKEKCLNISKTNTGIGLCTASEGTRNEIGPVGDTFTVMEGVTPSMIDMTMEKDKPSSVEDTTVLGSFLPLPTPVTTSAGNASGKSSYVNINGKPSGKKVNDHTLFTPGGNGIDVVVPVDSIRAISERFANTTYGFFRRRSSYARIMVELRADVVLNDNIVVAMPKITRECHYTCNVRVEYEWKPLRCTYCKLFGHIHEDCTKNTGAGEKKTVKKTSQTSRGVRVGPKMGFKPQKEYRPVTKKPNASSSGNKNNGVKPTSEATSSGSCFMNIDNDREFACNTSIGEKIDKIERKVGEGKLRLLDNDGNTLFPMGSVENDSKVEV